MKNKSIQEGRHAAGCSCGFCRNLGSFGKKKSDDNKKEASGDNVSGMTDNSGNKDKKESTAESIVRKMLDF